MINQYAISERIQGDGPVKIFLATGKNKTRKRKITYCAVAEGIISDSEFSGFTERGAAAHPAAVYRLSLPICGQILIKAVTYLTTFIYHK